MKEKRSTGEEAPSAERRDFFRKAGLGVGALGAAALTLTTGEAEAVAEEPRSGYRETDHVKRYYAAARF